MLKEYPLNRVFTLIEPGPALLVATADGRKKNIMTITWSMAMSFSPTFGIVTGSWNHSFDTMMKTRQCVVAVPGADLIDEVIGILSKLSAILADKGIGIFAVSTYNTDYILVKEERFDEALQALSQAGYTVTEPIEFT